MKRQAVFVAVVLALLVLAACGVATSSPRQPEDAPPPPTEPTETPVPATPPVTAPTEETQMPDPTAPTGDTPPPATDALATVSQEARTALAAYYTMRPDLLEFVSGEAQVWPDASLGCPDPAALYVPVETPGYRLLFTDGAQEFDVRTTDAGDVFILCRDGMPTLLPDLSGGDLVTGPESTEPTTATQTTPAPTGAAPADLIAAAQTAMADELGIVSDTLTLVRAEPMDWPDSSVGCPAPDEMYLQVITPGYLLIFSDGISDYPVHTARNGEILVLCRDGQRTVLS
ncbi:MAG: hypothetical protein HC876_11280 [Chloroflexaceae bacterium]|nr:hypothetical protein [Chloroflexaceae bacterium]